MLCLRRSCSSLVDRSGRSLRSYTHVIILESFFCIDSAAPRLCGTCKQLLSTNKLQIISISNVKHTRVFVFWIVWCVFCCVLFDVNTLHLLFGSWNNIFRLLLNPFLIIIIRVEVVNNIQYFFWCNRCSDCVHHVSVMVITCRNLIIYNNNNNNNNNRLR